MSDISTVGAIEFSDADLTTINAALLMLEQSFAGKLVFISAIESEEGHAVINIEKLESVPADCTTMMLTALPAFSNIPQWDRDEKVREQLQPIASRLRSITQKVLHTNRVVFQRCWNYSNKY